MVGSEKTATCQECREGFSYTPLFFQGEEMFANARQYCPACQEKRVIEFQAQQAKDRERDLESEWSVICPPLYRQTDLARLAMSPEIVQNVLDWKPNPTGIGIAGESGAGKTRLMFLLLKKLHVTNHRVMAMSGKKFENYCHRMFKDGDDARQRIEEAKQTSILFMDDIGKEKYTERVESEFYDVIETRTANLKPILWTANSSGQRLIEMMGEDRGTPIIRRLREFTTIWTI